MKVLLVSTTYFATPPPSYAGTEAVVGWLAEELHKQGHQVTVAAPAGSRFSRGIEHLETVTPQFGNMQEDAAWPKIQARLVDPTSGQPTGAFDIVHDHSFRAYSYMVAREHPDVKVTFTMHWQPHWQLPSGEAYGIVPGPPPVPHPNLIALSRAHAMLSSAVLGVHFEFVYNGIPLDAYPFRKEKGERAMFLGRIAKMKSPHEAVALANKYRFPIDIVGGDRFVDDPGYVQRVMESCRGFARYWGEVPQGRKLDMLSKARAVVLPYQWAEPFGLVPVEANACGTPVVALDVPNSAMSEIVQDGVNGFLCKTVDEMGEAVANVGELKPEECRRVVEEKFTAAKMAARYVELYERAIKEGW